MTASDAEMIGSPLQNTRAAHWHRGGSWVWTTYVVGKRWCSPPSSMSTWLARACRTIGDGLALFLLRDSLVDLMVSAFKLSCCSTGCLRRGGATVQICPIAHSLIVRQTPPSKLGTKHCHPVGLLDRASYNGSHLRSAILRRGLVGFKRGGAETTTLRRPVSDPTHASHDNIRKLRKNTHLSAFVPRPVVASHSKLLRNRTRRECQSDRSKSSG